MLALALAVLLGTGPDPVADWWWWGGAEAPSWTARFSTPGCIPSGTYLSPSTPLTVARAGSITYDTANVNQRTPGLITADANAVVHLVWDGTGLVNRIGPAWSMVGTVPQVAAQWWGPPGAGGFAIENHYSHASVDPLAGDGTVCVVGTTTTGVTHGVLGKNADAASGWRLQIQNGTIPLIVWDAAVNTNLQDAGAIVVGTPYVVCFGRSGATGYAKTNGRATLSGTVPVGWVPSSNAMRIGITQSLFGGYSQIHEVYATITPFNETTVAALQASVMAKINQPILATCPAATLPVGYNADGSVGAQVFGPYTQSALRSQEIATAGTNTIVAPWTRSGVADLVGAAALGPNGTMSLTTITNTASTGGVTQSTAVASTTTLTASAWMSKVSGTGTATVIAGGSGVPSLCGCGTSDGSACTAAVTATNYCGAKFTAIGTTPARGWVTGTWGVAFTLQALFLIPGDYGVSTGTANFGLASVHPGLYPMPYTPTLGTAVAVPATVSSVPLPSLHTAGASQRWCIGVTGTKANWTAASSAGDMVSSFSGTVTNVFLLGLLTTNTLGIDIYDAASGNKTVRLAPTGFADGSTHRIVTHNDSGTPTLYVDGVSAGVVTGAGTGLLGATPASTAIGGAMNGGRQFNGALRDLKIRVNPSSWRDCN